MDCIFCKIANGEIPSATLYEDDQVRVILDLGPAARGHALVLPKEHFRDSTEAPEALLGHVMAVGAAIGEAETKYPGSSKALVFWVLFIFESYLGAKVDAGEDADALKIVLKMIGNNDAEKTKFATSELAKDLTNPGFAKAFGIILKPLLSK